LNFIQLSFKFVDVNISKMKKKVENLIKSMIVLKNWPMYFLDRFAKSNVKLETRKGIKFKLRKRSADKGIILEVFFEKTYAPKGFEIKEGDVVIDIGAHIGVFSLFASLYTKNKIFSFEPLPENFKLLNENIKLNKKNNIKTFNLAVCGDEKSRYIFYDESNTGGHSLFKKGSRKIKIKCIKLENIFKKLKIERCNFLKIDCEGCEYEILTKADKEVFKKIDKIVMETHGIFPNETEKLTEILRSNGFSIKRKGVMLYAKKFNS